MAKRILVTGGAGFIGSHLVDALVLAGHDVAVVDNLSTGTLHNLPDGPVFFQQDICDETGLRAVFEQFRPDVVCHQAAQMSVVRSVRDPAPDAQVNILGLLNVASASVATGVERLVFASSGGVLYGETPVPADESAPLNPICPYGLSKQAGENYLRYYSREFALPVVALRYANVYGPRQNPKGEAGVVGIFSTRLLRGETATIHGDGSSVRDYIHVSDAVAATIAAFESGTTGFETINIGTGIGASVNQLAHRIREACQTALQQCRLPSDVPELQYAPFRPGELHSNLISCEKARSRLGWSARTSLDVGIPQTVAWFADQLFC